MVGFLSKGSSGENGPPSHRPQQLALAGKNSSDVSLRGIKTCRQSSDSTVDSMDENQVRGNWGGKVEFLLSCLSYAVGLGNLWRFPYLCYRNGGGAFLIPYVVMLIFTGIPMFFLELAFGQFASEGVISIWKVCPLMQGIGWGMFIVSSLIAMYYNMVIAWTLFYLFASFNLQVPWADCENHWNTAACGVLNTAMRTNCTNYNGTWFNHTCYIVEEWDEATMDRVAKYVANDTKEAVRVPPADEYFHKYVLDISEGFHDMGGIRWQLALCLLAAWILVGICLIRGIKSQGKVVYVTATFPYLVLLVLLIRGLTLPGSQDGIVYYLTPQWDRLLTAKVWGDAAVQIFFSLSPCWGGLITLASYNKFHNDCMRDSLVVSLGNCLTSFFAGFVIFGIIGFMAHEMHVGVDEVASGGAGLAFIIYPEVVSRLPISPLWAVMFFLMLITLGLGTQFSVVCTVHTTLLDVFPRVLRQGYRPMLLMVLICCIGYMMGLLCTTRGGMYMLQLIDNYAATYSLLIIGLCECVTISYIYGVDNFLKDIEMMLNRRPGLWWRVMWKFVTPTLLVFIMIFTWIDYTPSYYRNYPFPVWADVLGWCMTMVSVVAIPIVMVIQVCRSMSANDNKLSIWQTIKALSKPSPNWGPASEKNAFLRVNPERLVLNATPTPSTPQLYHPNMSAVKRVGSYASANGDSGGNAPTASAPLLMPSSPPTAIPSSGARHPYASQHPSTLNYETEKFAPFSKSPPRPLSPLSYEDGMVPPHVYIPGRHSVLSNTDSGDHSNLSNKDSSDSDEISNCGGAVKRHSNGEDDVNRSSKRNSIAPSNQDEENSNNSSSQNKRRLSNQDSYPSNLPHDNADNSTNNNNNNNSNVLRNSEGHRSCPTIIHVSGARVAFSGDNDSDRVSGRQSQSKGDCSNQS